MKKNDSGGSRGSRSSVSKERKEICIIIYFISKLKSNSVSK